MASFSTPTFPAFSGVRFPASDSGDPGGQVNSVIPPRDRDEVERQVRDFLRRVDRIHCGWPVEFSKFSFSQERLGGLLLAQELKLCAVVDRPEGIQGAAAFITIGGFAGIKEQIARGPIPSAAVEDAATRALRTLDSLAIVGRQQLTLERGIELFDLAFAPYREEYIHCKRQSNLRKISAFYGRTAEGSTQECTRAEVETALRAMITQLEGTVPEFDNGRLGLLAAEITRYYFTAKQGVEGWFRDRLSADPFLKAAFYALCDSFECLWAVNDRHIPVIPEGNMVHEGHDVVRSVLILAHLDTQKMERMVSIVPDAFRVAAPTRAELIEECKKSHVTPR